MKKIKVSSGYFATVDKESFEYLNNFTWYYQHGYARTDYYYKGEKFRIYMHIMVLGIKNGLEIDHINNNKLDNRKENLRFVTRSENMHNVKSKATKNKKDSLPRGVYKNGNKYFSCMKNNMKIHHLGTFTSVEEAKNAYDTFTEKMGFIHPD